jgi:CheY-like chemotaxis protein
MTGHPTRIALLDDDSESRALLVDLFSALGYAIERDVRAADVVIADAPGADGSPRLAYLTSRRPDLPLLVITRGSRADARRLARAYGLSLEQIVFKPYDAQRVARRVAAALERWRFARYV